MSAIGVTVTTVSCRDQSIVKTVTLQLVSASDKVNVVPAFMTGQREDWPSGVTAMMVITSLSRMRSNSTDKVRLESGGERISPYLTW